MKEELLKIIEAKKVLMEYSTLESVEKYGFEIGDDMGILVTSEYGEKVAEALGAEVNKSDSTYYDSSRKAVKRRYDFSYDGIEFYFFKTEAQL